MKRNFRQPILIFACLVFAASVVAGCDRFAGPATDEGTQTAPAPNPKLERQYREQLKAALEPYWQSQQVEGVREAVLALTAPGAYLNLHLRIVLAFEKMEQGRASADQAIIEEGLDAINALAQEYPWIQ